MVVVNAGHVGSTHGSGTVLSAFDVLGMSVVRGMTRVGRVSEMCMCLALTVGRIGGEWLRGLALGFTHPVGIGVVCGWCRWGVGRGLGPESGRLVLCLCEL